MSTTNIPGRYLYSGVGDGPEGAVIQTRMLLIVCYGTGLYSPCDTYAAEIAWGNSFDMTTIPWGQVYTATFTDTSGAPTSTSGPTPGDATYTCNNPWYGPNPGLCISRVDFRVSAPTNIMAVKMLAYGDMTAGGFTCTGGSDCTWGEPNGPDYTWIIATEGCSATIPVSCAGSASGPCQTQIIEFPIDGEEEQPCGGTGKLGITRALIIPARNAGDGSTQAALLTDAAYQTASDIATAMSGGYLFPTPYFDPGWSNAVLCAPTGETYDDPP